MDRTTARVYSDRLVPPCAFLLLLASIPATLLCWQVLGCVIPSMIRIARSRRRPLGRRQRRRAARHRHRLGGRRPRARLSQPRSARESRNGPWPAVTVGSVALARGRRLRRPGRRWRLGRHQLDGRQRADPLHPLGAGGPEARYLDDKAWVTQAVPGSKIPDYVDVCPARSRSTDATESGLLRRLQDERTGRLAGGRRRPIRADLDGWIWHPLL